MKIAYRRMSGAIGTSSLEQGTRGLWWEKRKALVQFLRSRGHKVEFINRMTKFSQQMVEPKFDGSHELLIVEFGSSNASFYGEDLEETKRMVSAHQGRIVFINDDPDLPYLWKTLSPEQRKQWVCWYNAKKPVPFGGQPDEIPCFDFPFSSLQEPLDPSAIYQKDHFVYVGRPNGRGPAIKGLLAENVPFLAYAKEKEWTDFPQVKVLTPPNQPQRAEFYRAQLASLVLADSKHKRMGWRTGRAYHAVMAGCPSIIESSHEYLLSDFTSFEHPSQLLSLKEQLQCMNFRANLWRREREALRKDRSIAEATAEAVGL